MLQKVRENEMQEKIQAGCQDGLEVKLSLSPLSLCEKNFAGDDNS